MEIGDNSTPIDTGPIEVGFIHPWVLVSREPNLLKESFTGFELPIPAIENPVYEFGSFKIAIGFPWKDGWKREIF